MEGSGVENEIYVVFIKFEATIRWNEWRWFLRSETFRSSVIFRKNLFQRESVIGGANFTSQVLFLSLEENTSKWYIREAFYNFVGADQVRLHFDIKNFRSNVTVGSDKFKKQFMECNTNEILVPVRLT